MSMTVTWQLACQWVLMYLYWHSPKIKHFLSMWGFFSLLPKEINWDLIFVVCVWNMEKVYWCCLIYLHINLLGAQVTYFVCRFVGVGARRVRSLFQAAKKKVCRGLCTVLHAFKWWHWYMKKTYREWWTVLGNTVRSYMLGSQWYAFFFLLLLRNWSDLQLFKLCALLMPSKWVPYACASVWLFLIIFFLPIFTGSLHHFHWWNRCCWIHSETMGRPHEEDAASITGWNGWFRAEWGI